MAIDKEKLDRDNARRFYILNHRTQVPFQEKNDKSPYLQKPHKPQVDLFDPFFDWMQSILGFSALANPMSASVQAMILYGVKFCGIAMLPFHVPFASALILGSFVCELIPFLYHKFKKPPRDTTLIDFSDTSYEEDPISHDQSLNVFQKIIKAKILLQYQYAQEKNNATNKSHFEKNYAITLEEQNLQYFRKLDLLRYIRLLDIDKSQLKVKPKSEFRSQMPASMGERSNHQEIDGVSVGNSKVSSVIISALSALAEKVKDSFQRLKERYFKYMYGRTVNLNKAKDVLKELSKKGQILEGIDVDNLDKYFEVLGKKFNQKNWRSAGKSECMMILLRTAEDLGLDFKRKTFRRSLTKLLPIWNFNFFFGASEGAIVGMAVAEILALGFGIPLTPLIHTAIAIGTSIFYSLISLRGAIPNSADDYKMTVNKYDRLNPKNIWEVLRPTFRDMPMEARGFLFVTIGMIIAVSLGPLPGALAVIIASSAARVYPIFERGFEKCLFALRDFIHTRFNKERSRRYSLIDDKTINFNPESPCEAPETLTEIQNLEVSLDEKAHDHDILKRRWYRFGNQFIMLINMGIGFFVAFQFTHALPFLLLGGALGALYNPLTVGIKWALPKIIGKVLKRKHAKKFFENLEKISIFELNHNATSFEIPASKRLFLSFLPASVLYFSLLTIGAPVMAASIVFYAIPVLTIATPLISRLTGFRASITNRWTFKDNFFLSLRKLMYGYEVDIDDSENTQKIEFASWYIALAIGTMTFSAMGAALGGLGLLGGTLAIGGAWGAVIGGGVCAGGMIIRNIFRVIAPGKLIMPFETETSIEGIQSARVSGIFEKLNVNPRKHTEIVMVDSDNSDNECDLEELAPLSSRGSEAPRDSQISHRSGLRPSP